MDKRVPINIDLDNRSITDFKKHVDVLEASIRRCCKSCDEPIKILEVIKNNEWYNTQSTN